MGGNDNPKNGGIGGSAPLPSLPALPVPTLLPALPKKKILPFLDVGSIKPLKGLNRSSSHEVPPVTARPRRRYIPRTKSMRLSSSPPPPPPPTTAGGQQQLDISPLRSCQRGGGIIAEDATDRSTGTDDTSLGSSFGSNLGGHGYSSSGGWRSPFGGIGGSGTSSAPRKRVRFSRSIKVINRVPRHPSPPPNDVNYDRGEQPQWVDVDDNGDDQVAEDGSCWVTKRNPDELMMKRNEEECNNDDNDKDSGGTKVALQEAYLSDSLFLFERMGGTPMTHHTPLIHQREPSKYFSSLAAGLDEGHRGVERWCGVVGRERQQKIDSVRRYVIDQHAKLVRQQKQQQQQQQMSSSSSSSPSPSYPPSTLLSKDEAADLVRAASLQGSAYSGRLAYFYGQVDALAVADKPSSLMMIVCMRTCLPPPSSPE